jgi:hypothetical protein
MEVVWFTLVAVVMYYLSDQILDRVEVSRGKRFEQRSLIFLAILLPMALGSFWLLRLVLGH